MTVKISNMDELKVQLARAYWIETQMEGASDWEFLMSYQQKYRDLILRLSYESADHRTMLKDICSKIIGLDIEMASQEDLGLSFDFKNKLAEEIIQELMKFDKMALETYTRLNDHTSKEFLSSVWRGKDPMDFYRTIQKIMNEEVEHIKSLSPFVGNIERIY